MRKGLDMNQERCGILSAYYVLGYAQSELVCMTCCLEMKSEREYRDNVAQGLFT